MVTGGAGYIGSHVARAIELGGARVVVLDDMSSGRPGRLGGRTLVEVDLAGPGAEERVAEAIIDHGVTRVVHLAARKSVPESIERPEWYYQQNVGGLAALLAAMRRTSCGTLVFSSSAAVYGDVAAGPFRESDPTRPLSPYGRTKLMGEQMVADSGIAWGLRHLSLRYFNVAGSAVPELADDNSENLVGIALGRWRAGEDVGVFGTDYDTEDGSCVRDFVHVQDVADAHVAALERLSAQDLPTAVLNVGTGRGTSVLELLATLAAARAPNGVVALGSRRAGDPASVVAAVDRIADELGWRATRTLVDMCESA